MKRILAILTTCLFFASLGCQPGEADPASSPSDTEEPEGASSVASTYVDPDKVVSEETGTLTVYWDKYFQSDAVLAFAKYAFKEKYPNVTVEMYEPSDGDSMDLSQVHQALSVQMMAGTGPDVIIEPQYSFPEFEKVLQGNNFIDLKPYLDKDESFNEANFQASILQAGIRDGKQYYMPLGYMCRHFITTQELLDETGINAENCSELVGLFQEMDQYYQRGGSLPMIDNLDSAIDILGCIAADVLDYSKRTADFSDPMAIKLVSLFKNIYLHGKNFNNQEAYSLLSNKQILFVNSMNMSFVLDTITELEKAGQTPVHFSIKYRDKNLGNTAVTVGITQNCKKSEIAYDYIRILMENENIQLNVGTPILKAARQKHWGSKFKQYNTVQLTDAEIEDIANVESFVSSNTTFSYKIVEFMEPYYKDEKSFESCLAELQNYYSIYISE